MIKLCPLIDAVVELNKRAAIELPLDAKQALDRAYAIETNPVSKLSLQMAQKNVETAQRLRIPMSGDTGMVRYYVKIGNLVQIEGGVIGLERALREATKQASAAIPLRENTVHPVSRELSLGNIGFRAPAIDYSFEPDEEKIEITVVQKGGIFGTDYRMLMPGEVDKGIRRFVVDTVCEFNRRGLVCGPVVVGIGLGGTKDQCMRLGKEAAVLRPIGSRHPERLIADLEQELLDTINKIGFGVMGTFGDLLANDVHIEIAHTAVNTLPIGIHHQDAALRRACIRVDANNRIEPLDDPNWFTPYLRFGSQSGAERLSD